MQLHQVIMLEINLEVRSIVACVSGVGDRYYLFHLESLQTKSYIHTYIYRYIYIYIFMYIYMNIYIYSRYHNY